MSEAEPDADQKGQGPVTAGDIEKSHAVEIINPEQVIAHLTRAAS